MEHQITSLVFASHPDREIGCDECRKYQVSNCDDMWCAESVGSKVGSVNQNTNDSQSVMVGSDGCLPLPLPSNSADVTDSNLHSDRDCAFRLPRYILSRPTVGMVNATRVSINKGYRT
jgi:hypothetical protein